MAANSIRHSEIFVTARKCRLYTTDVTFSVSWELSQPMDKTISIFHGCMVWIEKSVTRVSDRHHEACRVMPNSDPEGQIFLSILYTYDRYFFLHIF